MGNVHTEEGSVAHDGFFPRRPFSWWCITSALPLLDLAKICPLGLEELPYVQVRTIWKSSCQLLPEGLLQFRVAPLLLPFITEVCVLLHKFDNPRGSVFR